MAKGTGKGGKEQQERFGGKLAYNDEVKLGNDYPEKQKTHTAMLTDL